MDRNTSVYLDAARLLAAVLVVAGHVEYSWAPGFLPFFRTGHIQTLAVGVFFVLSGFVIGYVTDKKEPNAHSYFFSRAARVYSVVVPALVLTLLFDAIGKGMAPGGYGGSLHTLDVLKDAARAIVSLTFVNGFWRWHLQPGTNVAFWSIMYEVPYYVVFGLCFFGGVGCRIAAVVLLLAAGPYIAILFGLWLIGLGIYRFCCKFTLTQAQGRALLVMSLLCLCSTPYIAARIFPEDLFGGGFTPLAQLYLPGIPFAGTIVGFRFSGLSLDRWAQQIRWAAGATFTVYLVHFPVGTFLHAVVPADWPLAIRWFGIFATVIVSCFVVAQFTERRKEVWRRALERLADALRNRVLRAWRPSEIETT